MRTEDGSIIHRCLNGDPGAFGLLVDKYRAGVYALAYSKLYNFHDAEDVAQEAFIRAYENLHKLRRWESFALWLYRITSSLCKRWIRTSFRRPDNQFIDDQSPHLLEKHSMDSYRGELVLESLHEALDSLPDTHRQVLTLHYLGGMTSTEIARFVGVSPSAVRKRLSKARSLLKAEMLATMSTAYEEQRLQAFFTLRVMEAVKHIRIHPLPKDTLIPWGLSFATGLIIGILALGSNPSSHDYDPLWLVMARSTGTGEIPVTIVEQSAIENGGDEIMLKRDTISKFAATVAVLSVLSSGALAGEAPEVEWTKTFSTADEDAPGHIQQTSDGGYIIVGQIRTPYRSDIHLIKTDAGGNTEWEKIYGGTDESFGFHVCQTSDSGYIIAGDTSISSAGMWDLYLLKTDALGSKSWELKYGGSGNDIAYCIQRTSDGGYIVGGETQSFGHGSADAWLIKVDGNGNRIWDKTFGGTAYDNFIGVQETSDGGYIASGWTDSFGTGSNDLYLVKTDGSGNLLWEKTYGGSLLDRGGQVIETPDGGYIVSGATQSYGIGQDGYAIKVDANGTLIWQRNFGRAGEDSLGAIDKTLDGKYLLSGCISSVPSFGAGSYDIYLVKIDENGNMEWEGAYGTEAEEVGRARCTSDGGYIAVGSQGPGWGHDIYLVKVKAENQPPVADAGGPYDGYEGSPISFDASGSSDPDGDTLQYRWDFDNDGTWDTAWLDDPIVIHTYPDNWSGTVKLEVTDGKVSHTDTASVTVNNVAPTVGNITAPIDPVEVNTTVNVSANFTDPGWLDTHVATWDWGYDSVTTPGTISDGTVSGSRTYTSAGVYTVTLTVTDDDGGSGESIFQYIVVYDPSAGFVTGGGWMDSPEGAYAPDPSLTGKASFGFVSRYKKGTDIPTGQTQFGFHVADLKFHSTSYEWLVVAGHHAKFKGSGTVNGSGDYGFMLSAVDADLTPSADIDRFGIKIWEKSDGDTVVYDNQMGAADDADPTTEIGGGSIVIHGSAAAPPLSQKLPSWYPPEVTVSKLHHNFPNPFNPDTWIPYQLAEPVDVGIRIFDSRGHLIRIIDLGYRDAGSYISKGKAAYWDGRNEAGEQVASGMYFYTIQAGDFFATRKMVVSK